MNTRERFHALMNFQPFDRLPIVEWAVWWDKTIDRWHAEGLPAELTDRYDINRHFGQDVWKQGFVPHFGPGAPAPAHHGAPMIHDEAEYDRHRDSILIDPQIDKALWEQWAAEQERGDIVIWFTLEGFFWFPRNLFGIEPHMYAFYEKPDLMHRINRDLAEWHCRAIDLICTVCTPDFMTFAEDMSYNHGPMLSKALFDEFMKPYYDIVIPHLRAKGIIPIVDSDGDITVPAHWFEEAGLAGILPLERQAGVDVARLREEHPRQAYIGCFDKMCMNQGEEAMRREFERLLPVAAQSGFAISCDHQTPPGVSLEQYRLYLDLFQEYAEAAGRLSREKALALG